MCNFTGVETLSPLLDRAFLSLFPALNGVSAWLWKRLLEAAVALALEVEITSAYVERVGPLVKPDGSAVPLEERVTAVAQARAVPWLRAVGGKLFITKVPDAFASVMTLRDLALILGALYWEPEGCVVVELTKLVEFLTAREKRWADLLKQSGGT